MFGRIEVDPVAAYEDAEALEEYARCLDETIKTINSDMLPMLRAYWKTSSGPMVSAISMLENKVLEQTNGLSQGASYYVTVAKGLRRASDLLSSCGDE